MGTINRGYQTGCFSKPVMKQKVQPNKREQKLIERRKNKMDNRSEFDVDTYMYLSTASTSTTTFLEPGTVWTTSTAADSRYATGSTTTNPTVDYVSKSALELRLSEVEENNQALEQTVRLFKLGASFLQRALSELHVKFLELEHSDLQATEPFTYRVQKNELDELYEEVLGLFEALKAHPEQASFIQHKLELKGLL